MPIIGPGGLEGFFIIAGFSGHGFQHSPAAGRILAEMIVNGGSAGIEPGPFAIERFSTGDLARESNVV
jgi:glycine/D-amino acid oxidase-like deaminating enzyme